MGTSMPQPSSRLERLLDVPGFNLEKLLGKLRRSSAADYVLCAVKLHANMKGSGRVGG